MYVIETFFPLAHTGDKSIKTLSKTQGEFSQSWKIFMGRNKLFYATKIVGLKSKPSRPKGITCRGHSFLAGAPMKSKYLLRGGSKKRIVQP